MIKETIHCCMLFDGISGLYFIHLHLRQLLASLFFVCSVSAYVITGKFFLETYTIGKFIHSVRSKFNLYSCIQSPILFGVDTVLKFNASCSIGFYN